jgi:hypothetical protein
VKFNELLFFSNISFVYDSGGGCFESCTNLKEIIVPCPSNKTISRAMFYNDTKLEKVIIQEGVTTIVGTSFYNNNSLKYLELPSTLMGFTAYSGQNYNTFFEVPSSCKAICKAIVPPTVPVTAGLNVFNRSHLHFYVPDNSLNDYKAANGWNGITSRIHPISDYTG